jgi:translocation and assembly module TamB
VKRVQDGAEADLHLLGQNLLYYRSEGLRLRADTDLTVKGPISHLELAGEVAITDGYFSKYFDFLSTLKGSAKPKPKTISGIQLFSIREPPLKDMRFNVHVTSKNPFRIRNNVVNGSVRPDLKLSGTGELPVLIGKIYVEPTRLNLPSGSLSFESGVVRFDANNPDRPVLDLLGESSMYGYDITATVEGPYDEPVVTLTSAPPLADEDLLMMLLTGQQPKSTTGQTAAQRRDINVAMYIGRDLIARWFGSDVGSNLTSIVDRFDIQVGRAVTRSGDETIDAQFRLANGVLRKGDTLYITGQKDVFDFYNIGAKIVFRFK